MAQRLAHTDTSPYLSFVLAEIRESSIEVGASGQVLEELKEALAIGKKGSERRLSFQSVDQEYDGTICSLAAYFLEKAPPWLAEPPDYPGLRDRTCHLLLVLQRGQYIAVHGADPALKRLLERRLATGGSTGAFSTLRPLGRDALAAAFLANRPARTLWLSGLHRRSPIKADSKVLTGLDLRTALSPLDDQSYHYTSARSVAVLNGSETPVGASHRRSFLWVGPTRSWSEFHEVFKAIVDAIESVSGTGSDAQPFPILAEPAASAEGVEAAFDLAVVPPELLEDQPDAETLAVAERWAYRAGFEVVGTVGPNLRAQVSLDGAPIGTVDLAVQLSGDGRATVDVDGAANPGREEDFKECREVCLRPGWLTVRYESGHVLSDGRLFRQRYRDLPFLGWRFVSLGEGAAEWPTNPTIEKPRPAGSPSGFDRAATGTSDSLFCWVARSWFGLRVNHAPFTSSRGWLACDDGAGEIADFLHLDLEPPSGGPPTVTLLHVKAAKKPGPDRDLSVTDYEVVCGQAVKNLRFLDQANLADQLERNNKSPSAEDPTPLSALTWLDGEQQRNRDGFILALRRLGTNYGRRVVVLQPRVTKTAFEAAQRDLKQDGHSARAARLMQLQTLLLGTEANCREFGAPFFVFCSEI